MTDKKKYDPVTEVMATTLGALKALEPGAQVETLACMLADVGRRCGWTVEELGAEVKRQAAELDTVKP